MSKREGRVAPAFSKSEIPARSAGVEFHDQVGFHLDRVGHVRQLGAADEAAFEALVVDLDIVGDVALAGFDEIKSRLDKTALEAVLLGSISVRGVHDR